VQVADDGLLDLRQSGADDFIRHRNGSAEGSWQKSSTRWRSLSVANAARTSEKCSAAIRCHSSRFIRQQVRLEDGQGHQRGSHAEQNVVAQFHPPKRLQTQLVSRAAPAGEAHAARDGQQAHLAQFVISQVRAKIGRELLTKFFEAFARALERRVIADADEIGVSAVIAIGYHPVRRPGTGDEIIQPLVLSEGCRSQM